MTLDAALPLLVAIPILAAGITAFARARRPWTVVVLLLVQTAQLVAATLLVIETADGSVHAHQVGGWIPGIAIPFAVDAFSALMLTVAGGLILVCTLFALQVDAGRHRFYAPLVMVLQAGVVGTLLTADVFNMFVFIEVMLLPTYGLLVLAARGRGTRASVVGSRLYVTFNLFVSTLFLAGVAMIYGTAGTVNLAELAVRLEAQAAGAGVMTRERHRDALARAFEALDSARNEVLRGPDRAELAAEGLRQAARALESLVGRVDVEDLLDEIFARFCIGK